jgi:hypothetical protein
VKIFITSEAKAKLDFYVKEVPTEISGLGTVKIISRDQILIDNIYLLKQEVTKEGTKLNQQDIAMLIAKMIKNKQDPSMIRLWWHSHVNMSAFWSTSDDIPTINSFSKTTDWFLSLVINKQGDYLCRLDFFKPLRITLEIQLEIFPQSITEEEKKLLQEEVSQKLTVLTEQEPIEGVYYNHEFSQTGRYCQPRKAKKPAGNPNRRRGNRVTSLCSPSQDGNPDDDSLRQ